MNQFTAPPEDVDIAVGAVEASRLAGVTPVTIWRWVKAGDLPAWKVGRRNYRMRRSDVLAMVSPV